MTQTSGVALCGSCHDVFGSLTQNVAAQSRAEDWPPVHTPSTPLAPVLGLFLERSPLSIALE